MIEVASRELAISIVSAHEGVDLQERQILLHVKFGLDFNYETPAGKFGSGETMKTSFRRFIPFTRVVL